MENEILNENIELISIPGTLRVVYLNGRHGLFPVGTLISSIGQFTVRDSWLEAFDTGEYAGIFEVANLELYTYRAYGEARTAIKATIEAYALNDYDNDVVIEQELAQDPLEEESTQMAESELDDPVSDDNEPTKEGDNDHKSHVDLLMSFLSGDSWWEDGDDYVIDSTIGRENMRKCREALRALNYKFDPIHQRFMKNGGDE